MKTINNTPALTNANRNIVAHKISSALGKIITLVAILLMAALPADAQKKDGEVKIGNILYSVFDDTSASVKNLCADSSVYRPELLCNIADYVMFEDRKYYVKRTECGGDYYSSCGIRADILNLPAKLEEINDYFFAGLKLYDSKKQGCVCDFPASLKVIGLGAFEKSEIGAAALSENLESLAKYAFSSCAKLKSVSMGNKLRNIPAYAFADCTELSSLTLGDSIETIESWAFKNCKKITKLNLPNSLKSIGIEAFAGIDSLRQVTLPAEIDSVKKYAFGSCKNLILLTLSGNVPNFAEDCFNKNNNLLFIQVQNVDPLALSNPILGCENRILIAPDEAIEAYKNAEYWQDFKDFLPASRISFKNNDLILRHNGLYFRQMTNERGWAVTGMDGHRTSLDIPSEVFGVPVTRIDDFAFCGQNSIEHINLPETLTSIGYKSFASLKNLHAVVLPDSLKSISPFAFQYCKIYDAVINSNAALESQCFEPSLQNVTIGENVSEIPDGAFHGFSLKSVTFNGNKINRIGEKAFLGHSMSSIEIPEGVTSIGEYALSGSGLLTEVILPESLQEISMKAFHRENNIQVIENHASKPNSLVCASFSDEVKANATLYVHSIYKDWYIADKYWGVFKNIESIEGESNVRIFGIEDISGIEESIAPERPASSAAYNLAGQSANVNNIHGIVIKNGKKVLMR